MNTIDFLVLGAGCAFLLWFSWWFSLSEKRYHGIPRFFGFMGTYSLIWLNLPYWFINPLESRQILSWILLCLSVVYISTAIYYYLNQGKPTGKLENTTQLIQTGVYRFIRHPMYGSLMLLSFGAWLKNIDSITSILATVNFSAFYLTARIEEGEMIRKFGEEYRKYRLKTKMFLPLLF